jgi:phosphoglycolate phosphatase-like HAD superfamily hydrolase
MAADYIEKLKGFPKTNDFFVGIDSDGCAFDTMEVKHKFCFVVGVLRAFDLAALARILRDVWDYVNLYSQSRGCNRWLALRDTFKYLDELTPYQRFKPFLGAHLKVVDQFIRAADEQADITLSNTGLVAFALSKLSSEAAKTTVRCIVAEPLAVADSAMGEQITSAGTDPESCLLRLVLWTHLVNGLVARTVRDVPPFEFVTQSLKKLTGKADVMVVSATPNEALQREWEEHDIAQYAKMICGQELGSKKEHIQYGAADKYQSHKMLMVGDAPGDMKAAKANNALFFPVNPGDETASWQRLYQEAAGKFLAGEYAGDYEARLVEEFLAHLPSRPPWKK